MIFPETIQWTQRYMTGGDLLQKGAKIAICGNLWKMCSNTIIDFDLDTSELTSMKDMFQNSSWFTSVPYFDTSNVTNMENAFNYCSGLTTIPHFDTSNVTNMYYAFANCSGLTTIPHFDTSNVTNMSNAFESCNKLTEIPPLNTSKVTTMYYMFNYCSNLTTIPELDCSNIASFSIFGYSSPTKLVNLGGFKNLGAKSSISSSTNSYFLSKSNGLTHESLMNVINGLYDRKTAGYSTMTLSFGADNLAKLTDEEKAIATNKGWTLS